MTGLAAFILPIMFAMPVAAPLPQASPVEVGRDSNKQFAFDWDGKDEQGIDYTVPIQQVEFQFTPTVVTQQPRWVKVDVEVQAGENRIQVRDALVGVPAGDYDLEVRLIDVAGQLSQYGQPKLAIRVRVKNPSRPANVRVVGP